jgi:hypothetical protein
VIIISLAMWRWNNMAASTIADYLKYAKLQMAAEVFLKGKVPVTEAGT